MEERSDHEWVRLLKEQDAQAINDLWLLLYEWGTRSARKRDQSEDLGHDAAVRAFENIVNRGIYQFNFTGPFVGYCSVTVLREVLRLIKQGPHEFNQLDPNIHAPPEEPASDPAQIRARLQPCMDQLAPRHREVIDLLYLATPVLSPQEAADRLHLSRSNLHKISCVARFKLRQCLKALGYETADEMV